MADKIKCKGCGRMVWAGSKIIDGYCHDCYVRGRHLRPDNEPWIESPAPKKKPSPPKFTTPASRPRAPFSLPRLRLPKIRGKWLWIPLALLASALIFNGAFWLKSLTVKLSGEAAIVDAVRDEDSRAFYRRGEKLAYEAIYPNLKAIDEFIASGASYRMIGEFVYGYKDGRGTLANNFTTAAQADVEMSWNSETGVYKFTIRSFGAETDNKLSRYIAADGTYYIVKENGRTYVLSDRYGDRTAYDISENTRVYNVLKSYFMENLIDTSRFDKQTSAYFLWDGVHYNRAIILDNPGFLAFPDTRAELRAYQNRPVGYIYRNKSGNFDIEYNFEAKFYYDDIPPDRPSAAEYR